MVVQVVVLVTWILFRSATVGGAWQFLRNIATWTCRAVPPELLAATVFLVPVVPVARWQVVEQRGTSARRVRCRKGALAAAMAAASSWDTASNAFIYFQF